MISFFVSCETSVEVFSLLLIITLCNAVVILFAIETMLYLYFIHVHIFMMSSRII